nr:AIM24 family protein [Streptococcus vestibularis]
MQFFTASNMHFPLVELSLNQGEQFFIQRGSMVYHTQNVTLTTKLNASGSGLVRFVKAVGRSMVSGDSSFITQVISQSNNGFIALAPDS